MTQVRHAIDCPRCKAPAEVVTVDSLELDRCASCGGFWFDAGEIKQLRALSDDKAVRERLAVLLGATADAKPPLENQVLACPVCALKMIRRHHEDAPGVVIDRCPTHGTWLDRGETLRLLALVEKTTEARQRELAKHREARKQGWLSAILDLFD